MSYSDLKMETSAYAGSEVRDVYEDILEVPGLSERDDKRVRNFRLSCLELKNQVRYLQEEIARGGRDSYARARTGSSINPRCPELGGKTLEDDQKVGIREWRCWRSKI